MYIIFVVGDFMKDIDFESIGKKLKEIRLSKGLPQDAVASAAEVNTSHISNIENNRVKVSLPTLIYICNALGVTVDYVLSGEYTGDYSSIDREIMKEIQSLSDEEKERVLRVVRALKYSHCIVKSCHEAFFFCDFGNCHVFITLTFIIAPCCQFFELHQLMSNLLFY